MRETWRVRHAAVRSSALAVLGMPTGRSELHIRHHQNSKGGGGGESNSKAHPTLLQQAQGKKKMSDLTTSKLDMSIYEAWIRPMEAMMVRRKEAARFESSSSESARPASARSLGGAPHPSIQGSMQPSTASNGKSSSAGRSAEALRLPSTPRSFGIPLEPWHQSQLSVQQQLQDQRTLELRSLAQEVRVAAEQDKLEAVPILSSDDQQRRRTAAACEAGISISPAATARGGGMCGHLGTRSTMDGMDGDSKHIAQQACDMHSTSMSRLVRSVAQKRPPPVASSRKRYAYKGWQPATVDAVPRADDTIARTSSFTRHMTSSTSALTVASSFVPSIKVSVDKDMGGQGHAFYFLVPASVFHLRPSPLCL